MSRIKRIYGFFELAILFFYPGFMKKTLYAIFISIGLFLLPVLNIPGSQILHYYMKWFSTMTGHLAGFQNYSLFRLPELFSGPVGNISGIISVAVFLLLFGAAMVIIPAIKNTAEKASTTALPPLMVSAVILIPSLIKPCSGIFAPEPYPVGGGYFSTIFEMSNGRRATCEKSQFLVCLFHGTTGIKDFN